MNELEYRAYFFGNMYFSQIQQGIQSAHALTEMYNYYPNNPILTEWGQNHKTMILLNGGSSVDLQRTFVGLENVCSYLKLPCSQFHEDASVNFALTCIGVIVPSYIYDKKYYEYVDMGTYEENKKYIISFNTEPNIMDSEWFQKCTQLHELLRSCRLA